MKVWPLCLLMLGSMVVENCAAAAVQLAGSTTTPPGFQTGSHFQITPIIDRAHPIALAMPGSFRVEELQIAAYRLAGLGGLTAEFAIHSDDVGVPGSPLTTFSFADIPLSTPAVLTAAPNSPLVLHSGTPYWVVGTTDEGQVNWSLAMGAFPPISVNGTRAFQLRDDPWVVSTGNLAAYAVLGSQVPEPSLAAVVIGLTLLAVHRRVGTRETATRRRR